jgi:hypothetical protein
MKMTGGTVEASKYTSLKKLYAIRDNHYCGYHSKSKGQRDYDPKSVDDLIHIKEGKNSDKANKQFEKDQDDYQAHLDQGAIDSGFLDGTEELLSDEELEAYDKLDSYVEQSKETLEYLANGSELLDLNEHLDQVTELRKAQDMKLKLALKGEDKKLYKSLMKKANIKEDEFRIFFLSLRNIVQAKNFWDRHPSQQVRIVWMQIIANWTINGHKGKALELSKHLVAARHLPKLEPMSQQDLDYFKQLAKPIEAPKTRTPVKRTPTKKPTKKKAPRAVSLGWREETRQLAMAHIAQGNKAQAKPLIQKLIDDCRKAFEEQGEKSSMANSSLKKLTKLMELYSGDKIKTTRDVIGSGKYKRTCIEFHITSRYCKQYDVACPVDLARSLASKALGTIWSPTEETFIGFSSNVAPMAIVEGDETYHLNVTTDITQEIYPELFV